MTRGTVRTSTRGGHSVLRSAAAVEAAALRSFGLGATVPLAALGNPLAMLLGEGPDLSALDQVLGQASGPAPVRRSAARAGQPAAPAPHRTPDRTPTRATSTSAPVTPGTSPSTGASTTRPGLAPARSNRKLPDSLHGTPDPMAAGGAGANQPGAARSGTPDPGTPRATSPAISPASPAELNDDQVRAASSTGALRRAARTRGRSTTTAATDTTATSSTSGAALAPASPTSRGSAASTALPAALRGTLPEAISSTRPLSAAPARSGAAYPEAADPSRSAPTSPRGALSGGGLAELVTRWQDGESSTPSADSLPAPVPAFAPLPAAALQRERPLRLGDDERVELAIEQILRREVEQHGLDGGC
jgi:hypothetical protein